MISSVYPNQLLRHSELLITDLSGAAIAPVTLRREGEKSQVPVVSQQPLNPERSSATWHQK